MNNLAKDEAPKPIFDIGIHQIKSFSLETTLAKFPDEILSLNEEALTDYTTDVFEKHGQVFTSHDKRKIILLSNEDSSKLLVVQKILERFEIDSLIYYNENTERSSELFILEQTQVEKFFEIFNCLQDQSADPTLNYILKIDWED